MIKSGILLFSIVTVLTLCMFFQCKEIKLKKGDHSSITTNTASQENIDYKKLFEKISVLKSELMKNPAGTQTQKKFLDISFDTLTGCFYTVGHGIQSGKHEKRIEEELQKRAAEATAQRWALYLKSWYLGRSLQFGEPVSGAISYSNVVYSNFHNDTLFVMMQTPLGSISD